MTGKFIVVVGGVYSGTGKGISAASIGLLLKMRGSNVELIKLDPYLNVNAGTMNPRQHGEVFLCDDGSETDLDLGHYERITDITMSGKNIFTSGTLYKELLSEEEQGQYLGETVQVIPHVTGKVHERLKALGTNDNIVIAEIGGTVGDIESSGFYEAIRQFKQANPDNVMVIMVAPVIWNATVKEFKTKPLQNSVKTLLMHGIQPEMLLCRTDRELPKQILDKVARLTNVSREAVFEAPDVSSIYQVPIEFYDRHVDDLIADKFHLPRKGVKIHKYRKLVEAYIEGEDYPDTNIAIVGKYDNCDEAYQSLKEALVHASVDCETKVKITWINAEELEGKDLRSVRHIFKDVNGVIVPGGFDSRGVEGKTLAIRYCREKKIPFLGICLGLQCAVIEFAQNVLGWDDATSREFSKKKDSHRYVIDYVDGQENIDHKSGTMRLGSYDCILEKGIIRSLYGNKKNISERHRHRYEVNGDYVCKLEKKGFRVVGRTPESNLVEMMELDPEIHPYFVGTQAHPEFKSRFQNPAPLFVGLLNAAKDHYVASTTKSG